MASNLYTLTALARQELHDIWSYISRDNIVAADAVVEAFFDTFELLGEYPDMGHLREDLTHKPVRFWNVHSYMIIYDPRKNPIQILRVRSGYNDLMQLLDDEL